MKKVIVIINKIKDPDLAEVNKWASDYEVKALDDITDEDLSQIEVLYGYDNDLAERMETIGSPALKWVQVQFAGVNTLPDRWLSDERITVTNMSGIHAIPIAETVYGYMLGYIRQFQSYVRQQKQADFTSHDARSLTDKTIAVFGAGNIGQEISRLAKAFRMKTVGINTSGRQVDFFDTIYKTGDDMPLVRSADFIVNVLPLTKETTEYFDAAFFDGLEQSPLFINVGRGQAVNDQVLIDALDTNKLSYAALDVFWEEPLAEDHPFWSHDQIFITPHISGRVEHFAVETYKIFQANLKSYLESGQADINVVDSQKGY